MPWCPKCKTEYPEDAESCALCNAKLIEQQPNIQEVIDQRVPGNWRTVAEVAGLSWLANQIGIFVCYIPMLFAAALFRSLGMHIPRTSVNIAAWVIMYLFVASAAYWYGRITRRQLRIGYVYLGWLLWPAWGVTLGIFIPSLKIQFGRDTFWALVMPALYTAATLYGQRVRQRRTQQEGG